MMSSEHRRLGSFCKRNICKEEVSRSDWTTDLAFQYLSNSIIVGRLLKGDPRGVGEKVLVQLK